MPQHKRQPSKPTHPPSPSSGKLKRKKLAVKRTTDRLAKTTRYQTLNKKERDAAIERGEIIIADLSKQAPNNSYDPPIEYRDYQFTCQGCGRVEIWTAKQQQWWYEVAKGSIYGRAVRCRTCRQKARESKRSAQLPKKKV